MAKTTKKALRGIKKAAVRKTPKPAGKKKAAEPAATRIAVLLDRSGSMDAVRDETISGFNHFLAEQQKAQGLGKCIFTLVQFDSVAIEITHDGDIVSAKPLTRETFQPRGMTPLYDAIGQTIQRHKEKMLFVILTDGLENSSREYDRKGIQKLIAGKEAEGWTFVYLGANQDAFAVGAGIGIGRGNTLSYNTVNLAATMGAVSRGSHAYRGAGGQSMGNFTATAAAAGGETEEQLRQRLKK